MKFRNQYRTESIRLKHWDYSNPGLYFVTICTKKMQPWFGTVFKRKMILNETGEIAHNEWMKTELLRDNVQLDEFVIMPNHIHGIIEILNVETRLAVSLPEHRNKFGPLKKGSLSTIIGSFKSSVTKRIYEKHPQFAWQSRFYEHIIRNEHSLEYIQHYIKQNPENWDHDHHLIYKDPLINIQNKN